MQQVRYLGGRYRLVEQLGAGGMSVVWRGYDEVLGRAVAVKVLAPTLAADQSSRVRIRSEAQAAGRLSHPHITPVHDFGESEIDGGPTVPYVVMELVDGSPLDELLAQGPLPWRVAAQVCAQTAAALAAAHAHGLVHRDVKPANVMLTSTGAKLVDFGISAVAGDHADGAEGQLLGTPAYLAPERLAGGPTTPATDVYALGLVLYKAIKGELPWQVESTTEMLRAHCYLPPSPLPPLPGLPDEIRQICERCLAKVPDGRPTAIEVAHTLAVAAGVWVNTPDTAPVSPAPGYSAPVSPAPGYSAPVSPAPVGGRGAAAEQTELSVEAQPAAPVPRSPAPAARQRVTLRTRLTARRRLSGSRRSRVLSLGAGVAALAGVGFLTSTCAAGPPDKALPQAAADSGGIGASTLVAEHPASCEVRYELSRDSGSEFAVRIGVTNLASTAVPDWTLNFAFPADQRVLRGTGGAWTQRGNEVTVTRAVADAGLPPGAGTALEFTGAYAGVNLLPTAFTLNGMPCRLLLAAAAGGPAAPSPTPSGRARKSKKG